MGRKLLLAMKDIEQYCTYWTPGQVMRDIEQYCRYWTPGKAEFEEPATLGPTRELKKPVPGA